MTDSLRLGVLFTPSPLEPLWRQALAEHMAAIGWDIMFPDSAEDARTDDVGHCLIVSHDVWAILACQPTTWVVLADGPDAAAECVTLRLGEETLSQAGRSVAASHMAWAGLLAGQGFPVLDARQSEIDLPYIGVLQRPSSTAPAVIAAREPALAMFETLPVPVGARAEWTPAHFTYPIGDQPDGGSPILDMTGRIRPVVFGPHIDLPPGTWQVDARIAVDPEGGRAHVRFEWGALASYVVAITPIDEPGEYSLSMVRAWSDPEPAQMRLWIPQPLFQGRMEFLGCTVTRVPDDTPLTSSVTPQADEI